MSTPRQILAAIFDMDGLLVDSEPLWDQAELDVMASLGVDISAAMNFPIRLAYASIWWSICGLQQPWNGPHVRRSPSASSAAPLRWWKKQTTAAGVREAVALCKSQGIKVGLASASPLHMLEKVLTMFDLRSSFDALASAEKLPYSKPHPQVYLDCATKLGIDSLNCVALEDSVNGMIASKAARMRSIVVPAHENQDDPASFLPTSN
jgi:sugar-phosphatase